MQHNEKYSIVFIDCILIYNSAKEIDKKNEKKNQIKENANIY